MQGKGKVVPHELVLLARVARSQKAMIEGCARITAAGGQAAAHLESARAALLNVAEECARAGERFAQARRFRAECEAAAALDSVADMIRRRDELLALHRGRRVAQKR